ncbi:MAG: hypothetical protein GXO02_04480, partial [Epsilonproteobacteria bacterium]|nr:hypothetical protein [Campylobacterota bacterium]
SLHQMIPKNSKRFSNRYFFGESEGNVKQNRVVHLYKFKRVGLKLKKVADLPLVLGNIRGFAGHNLFITPDLKYLYAPVGAIITQDNKLQKGGVFVVDAKSMKIISFIPAGFGAGHVAFSPKKGYAIITNHKDEFLTIADYRTHKFITNIYPNFPHQNIASLNFSHSQYVDESGEYYYNFWSDGGVFFRLNLNTLEIDDFINVGGVPIQGNFVKEVSTACRIPQIAPTDGFEELFGSWFNKDKVDPKDSSKVINGYNDKKEFRKRLLKEIQRIRTILKKNKNLSKYTQEYLKRLLRVYWRMIKGV